MLVIGWYPKHFFRLSFGVQDKLGRVMGALHHEYGVEQVGSFRQREALRTAISAQYDAIKAGSLVRFVTTCLLAPFTAGAMRGINDPSASIRRAAAASFETEAPYLYRLVDVPSPGIEIHPRWSDYLLQNISIVSGWAERHWIDYLQRRNPNTPNVSAKLRAPLQRTGLRAQREYWQLLLESESIRCPYSTAQLNAQNFALDHFLPWTFVCHDQLWNLVPVKPEINASKGDHLPNVGLYLEDIVRLHHQALSCAKRMRTEASWRALTDDFVQDLRISRGELLDFNKLMRGYERTVIPMHDLAVQLGFDRGWEHRSIVSPKRQCNSRLCR